MIQNILSTKYFKPIRLYIYLFPVVVQDQKRNGILCHKKRFAAILGRAEQANTFNFQLIIVLSIKYNFTII